MASTRPEINCREIRPADVTAIVTLLQKGFPERDRAHWVRGLQRMAERATPPGFPKFGYMLEFDANPIGVILVIFSSMTVGGQPQIRGNVASWYVEPAFRSYATMLTSHALSRKSVTYLNVSPAPWTWQILKAQGYLQYCTGQFLALAALGGGVWSARVRAVTTNVQAGDDLAASEAELLREHAGYGCLSVTCSAANRRHPFVFMRCWHRWKFGRLPYALLIYCRNLEEFIRFAGPLGRFLAWRGMPMIFIDSNGPIAGLIGKPLDMGPKFFRGPHPPHLGDVAYTEQVFFSP
jgi:hypothetical protein